MNKMYFCVILGLILSVSFVSASKFYSYRGSGGNIPYLICDENIYPFNIDFSYRVGGVGHIVLRGRTEYGNLVSFSLVLRQVGSFEDETKFFTINTGTGNYWMKGSLPILLRFYPVYLEIDKTSNTALIVGGSVPPCSPLSYGFRVEGISIKNIY